MKLATLLLFAAAIGVSIAFPFRRPLKTVHQQQMSSPYGICDPGLHPEELKQRVCNFLGIHSPCDLPPFVVSEQHDRICRSQTRAKMQQHVPPFICDPRVYITRDQICDMLPPQYCGTPLEVIRENECPRRAEAFVKSQQSEQIPADQLFGKIKKICDDIEPLDADLNSVVVEVIELCDTASKIKERVQELPPFEGEIKETFDKVEEMVTSLCHPASNLDFMQYVEEVRTECTEWKNSPPSMASLEIVAYCVIVDLIYHGVGISPQCQHLSHEVLYYLAWNGLEH